MTVVLLVAKMISGYQGYIREKRKDDDIRVKKVILSNLTSLKNHLHNIYSLSSDVKKESISKKIRNINDKVDVFIQEVEYSSSGHKYPFFSPQCSVGILKLNTLIKYDLDILKNFEELITKSSTIESDIIDGSFENCLQMIKDLNNQFNESKSLFKKRTDIIKGVSDKKTA